MKTLVKLNFLAFTLFAIPAQAGQYLTDAQKASLLKQSSELGSVREKANAQNAIARFEQTNVDHRQSELEKFLKAVPTAASSIQQRPIVHKSMVVSNARPKTQSLQSMLRNTDWGVPVYTNYSAQPSQQVAARANNNRAVQQGRQVAASAGKFNWWNLFMTVSAVANALSSGLNQANSQFYPSIQQPNILNLQQPNNQIINTYRVGNQTFGVGGNQDFRAYDVGNLTFGRMGDQEFSKTNIGDMSIMKIGNTKLRCYKVANQEFCK